MNNEPATKQDIFDLTTRLEHLTARLERGESALVEHIQSVGGSLHTQMQEMENRLTATFESTRQAVQARLDRQGGLLRGGSIQITRLLEWSERVDEIIASRDKRIEDLEARLRKLEGEKN
jgi:hypothetical protein